MITLTFQQAKAVLEVSCGQTVEVTEGTRGVYVAVLDRVYVISAGGLVRSFERAG